jgi:hypothetical protein
VDLIDTKGIESGTNAGKIRFHQSDPIGEGGQPLFASGQRRIVPIQADQSAALRQPPCYLEGVTSAAGCAVHIYTAAFRSENLHTLGG